MDDASPTDDELDFLADRLLVSYLALLKKLNQPSPADLPAVRARIKQRELEKRKRDEVARILAEREVKLRARWEYQSLASNGGWEVVARRGEVTLESLGAEPIAIRQPAVPFPCNLTWDLDRAGGKVLVDAIGYAWAQQSITAAFRPDGLRLTIIWTYEAHEPEADDPRHGWEYSHAHTAQSTWAYEPPAAGSACEWREIAPDSAA